MMGEARCPHCGRVVTVTLGTRAGMARGEWKAQTGTAFYSGVQMPGATGSTTVHPAFTEATRTAPARPATVESDVVVPLLQALGTGAALLLPAGVVSWWAGWPWWATLLLAASGATVVWLRLVSAHHRLLWLTEHFVNDDVSEDVPAPDSAPTVVQVATHTDGTPGAQYRRFELPDGVDWAMFRAFAAQAEIKGLSQGAWCGSGRVFSRAQFEALMGRLHEAGIVAWRDEAHHSQGRRLTTAGKHALRHIAAAE